MVRIAWLAVLLVACAHDVAQDRATGPDGRIQGAREIVLDNGEGRARGIVTYPGGDRVDWRAIQLPGGKQGNLDLELTARTPRPGLRVAFDVFDQWNARVAVAHRRGRRRVATVHGAKGKYFVRVYAPRRGDAGEYQLVARFSTYPPPPHIDNTIPDPPHLPAVPAPEETCVVFDPKIDACKTECPAAAPPGWPGCHDVCRTPDPNNPACWGTMACPAMPDRRIRSCMVDPASVFPPCPDPDRPDPRNPRCDPQAQEPVIARIVKLEVQDDGVVVTIAAGRDQHVSRSWKGVVLHHDTDAPIAGGTVRIVRVGRRMTVAKIRLLTLDQINANPMVRLSPK